VLFLSFVVGFVETYLRREPLPVSRRSFGRLNLAAAAVEEMNPPRGFLALRVIAFWLEFTIGIIKSHGVERMMVIVCAGFLALNVNPIHLVWFPLVTAVCLLPTLPCAGQSNENSDCYPEGERT